MGLISKLDQLREKTDSELAAVVANTIERGLRMVRGGDDAEAGRAYEEARRALPAIYDRQRRNRVEGELHKLRVALDALGSPPAQSCRAAGG